ncbi:N-acetylmuramoyl-L-alanine amidase [Lachnospiraceae bacterium NSJ-143]|nr:N-acetylmuramoyl-L-alanine amidase [Lachnospiraceae bacterium NSJ-143]
MNEKEINLDIANKLCLFLEEAGADVYMTRPEDTALGETKSKDMKSRINIIEDSGADIMVSVHQNSFPSQNVKGAQSFYFKESEDGKLLAECIQKSLIQALDEKNTRVAKENNNYYILKNTQIPSVIIECGFLSNPEEEKKLNNEEYRLKTAWALFDGIRAYFEAKENGSMVMENTEI